MNTIVEETKWISVKVRKPRSGRLVMTYTPDKTILESNALPGCYWSDSKDWTVYDFHGSYKYNVTHWQPLPSPPKSI